MSQEKVDRYKQEKANRKQIMKKRKMKNFFLNASVAVVAVVLVGWIGYSAFHVYQSGQDRRVVEANYESVDSYLNEISK